MMVISGKMRLECSEMATEYGKYKILVDIDVRREFHVSEVKVPVRFFGTGGFSARRDGRYSILFFIPLL